MARREEDSPVPDWERAAIEEEARETLVKRVEQLEKQMSSMRERLFELTEGQEKHGARLGELGREVGLA